MWEQDFVTTELRKNWLWSVCGQVHSRAKGNELTVRGGPQFWLPSATYVAGTPKYSLKRRLK